LAVAEAARNVVCSGARPLAITNCLNFASPERPEVMWAFSETVDGIAEVCRALGTPVTGGNVSFYNETEGKGVYPTPVIGMLGVIEDARHTTTQWFKETGDLILLLGHTRADLGASELLASVVGEVGGAVPQLDLAAETAVQQACLTAIESGLVRSAHDCSDGGLAVALAESCFAHYRHTAIGADINLPQRLLPVTAEDTSAPNPPSTDLLSAIALLFGESPSRIIISARPENVERVIAIAEQASAPCTVIGQVGGTDLRISLDGDLLIEHPVAELEAVWRNSLVECLDQPSQLAAD